MTDTRRPRSEIHAELWAFVRGKTISSIRFDDASITGAEGPGDIDLLFTDGSELELYGFEDGISWIEVTPEEAAAHAAEIAAADAAADTGDEDSG